MAAYEPTLSLAEWSAQNPVQQMTTTVGRLSQTRTPRQRKKIYTYGEIEKKSVQYDLDPIISSVTEICDAFIQAVGTVDAQMQEIIDLLDDLRRLRNGIPIKATTVTILGQQGIGKSTLINALLERVLASPNANDRETVDITVRFLSAEARRAIDIEHIRRTEEQMDPSPEDGEEVNDRAESANELQMYLKTAQEHYGICFETKNNTAAKEELRRLLTLENIRNGVFLEALTEKAEERIAEIGANENGVLEIRDISIQDLHRELGYMAKIFPLVDVFEIAVSADLLKYGLNLLDSPGFEDTNQTRTAAANLRHRKADVALIMAPYKRLLTNARVLRWTRQSLKAHGAMNTMLGMGPVDEIEVLRTKVLTAIDQKSNRQCAEVSVRFDELDKWIEEDFDARSVSPIVAAYDKYLYNMARCSLIREEVDAAAAELKADLVNGQSMHVFGIAPREYQTWKDPFRHEDPDLSPTMTGIPAIIQHLLQLPEKRYYQSYKNLVYRTLPDAVDKIDRIINKHYDEPQFEDLRTKASQRVQQYKDSLSARIAALLENLVSPIWSTKDEAAINEKVTEALKQWGNFKVNTYGMIMRERGITMRSNSRMVTAEEINWNRELLEVIDPEEGGSRVEAWKDRILEVADGLSQSIEDDYHTFGEQVTAIIDEPGCDAGLKERLKSEWSKNDVLIFEQICSLPDDLKAIIEKVYADITTEEDIGCMIATQEAETYQTAASVQQGLGVHKRQKKSMHKGMLGTARRSKSFSYRYRTSAMEKMKTALKDGFDDFTTAVTDLLSEFTTVLDEFVLDPESERQEVIDAKTRLERAKGPFQEGLEKLKQMFPTDARHEAQERPTRPANDASESFPLQEPSVARASSAIRSSVGGAPSKRTLRTDDDSQPSSSSSPSKKIKTEPSTDWLVGWY
ncbi:hypothetical protein CC80DRAFT_552155 [Byssothecium circinans]|uniref:P-loop containing nucleoside triphosphate hydrolase protein n=1 Tax=Byssothecium circinans TaxID=147558 RepID=A0A6A5TJV8_9PLEO|nr:hypothetical protein CC80DRAFT_552155 [Byssothecium circinans]